MPSGNNHNPDISATIPEGEPLELSIAPRVRYKTTVERSHDEILRGLCEVADGIKKIGNGLGMITKAYARLHGLEQ